MLLKIVKMVILSNTLHPIWVIDLIHFNYTSMLNTPNVSKPINTLILITMLVTEGTN